MMASVQVRIRSQATGSGPNCRRILEALPAWFGIPQSVEGYVSASDRFPTAIASIGDNDVGILTWLVRTPFAAEVYVMGVLPELHNQGIGRQMLDHVEDALAKEGVEFLQVKTLSSHRIDEGYERTRAFYLSCGFQPLEEFPDLWDHDSPAVQLIKKVTSAPA
jgi:GNAT superfamily N-acetyltransferase